MQPRPTITRIAGATLPDTWIMWTEDGATLDGSGVTFDDRTTLILA